MDDILVQLRTFLEYEAKSCSMDYGCVTPHYVYRMLGGQLSLEEIEKGLAIIRAER